MAIYLQAKYTDRAAATTGEASVEFYRFRLLNHQRNDSLQPLISSNSLLSYSHEAERIPFQTHCFSENVIAPEIESGTSRSIVKYFDYNTTEAISKLLIDLKLSIENSGHIIGNESNPVPWHARAPPVPLNCELSACGSELVQNVQTDRESVCSFPSLS